jgi:hypothetical protein
VTNCDRSPPVISGENDGTTLQPTALVNEAYLRLIDQDQVCWQNRATSLHSCSNDGAYLSIMQKPQSSQRGGGACTLMTPWPPARTYR